MDYPAFIFLIILCLLQHKQTKKRISDGVTHVNESLLILTNAGTYTLCMWYIQVRTTSKKVVSLEIMSNLTHRVYVCLCAGIFFHVWRQSDVLAVEILIIFSI